MSEEIPERAIRLADGRILRYPALPHSCTYFSVDDPTTGATTVWPIERWDVAPASLLVAVLLGTIRHQGLGMPAAPSPSAPAELPMAAPVHGNALPRETAVAGSQEAAGSAESAAALPVYPSASIAATAARRPPASQGAPRVPARAKPSPLFAFVNANAFALVGVGMVLLGFSFLFPLLIENGYFPPMARASLGFLFGLALTGLGWTQRQTRRGYSLAAQGGGFAVMYLSVYAAHRVYALMGSSTAFACFVLLSAALFGLAISFRAIAMSIIGIVGAYLAPILVVQSGAPLAVPLLYAFFLAAVCMFASSRTGWRALNIVSMVASTILSILVLSSDARPPPADVCAALLVGYLLLYSLEPVIFRVAGFSATTRGQRNIDAALTYLPPPLIAYLFSRLPGATPDTFRNTLGVEALWFAVLWFANQAKVASFADDFGRLALLLGTVALGMWVPDQQLGVLYAVEGMALCYLGIERAGGGFLTVFGIILRVLSFLCVAFLVLNHEAATTAVGVGYLSAAGAFFFAFTRDAKLASSRAVEFITGLIWSYLAFLAISSVRTLHDLGFLAAIASYTAALALALHLLARLVRWIELQGAMRYTVILVEVALFALGVLPGADRAQMVIAANFGVALLLVVSAFISMMNFRLDAKLRFSSPGVVHVVMALLLGTELIAVIFRTDNAQVPLAAIFGGDAFVGTTVTLMWGIIGLGAATLGARHLRYRRAGMMLMAVAGGKLILFDMSQAGTLARVVSFIGLGGLYLLVGALAPKSSRARDSEGKPHTEP